MLTRMYGAWATRMGYEPSVLGSDICGMIVDILNPKAAEFLQSEAGVHRLVRISPFDDCHRRTTTFALVGVDNETTSSWDTPIRSYVLDPYMMVRDHRLGTDCTDVLSVLSGNLELVWGEG